FSLIFNYMINNGHVNENKRSFKFTSDPSVNTIDTAFSSLINFTVWHNQGGVSLNYNNKKSIYKIGNNIKFIDMNIENILNQRKFNKQFINWNPQATFNHKFTTNKTMNINYFGNSINPERTQIIPYNYNNSQLVTYIPNLTLKNSFSSS